MNAADATSSGGAAGSEDRLVFLFSGQGSYSRRLLRELYRTYPQTWQYFHQANDTAKRFLECEFLPLVTAATDQEHDEWLKAHPDLDQIGIYLGSVLTAQILLERGTKPGLLVGHSFGELAALATAGVYTIESGMRIVCQRVISLQALADTGQMAALSCNYDRAREAIDKLGQHALEISVLNHPRQTVVSGTTADLDRLAEALVERGISLTMLKSRYPYHSSRLRRAVRVFAAFLRSYAFMPADIPVLLSMEGTPYSPACDLAKVLSSHFVQSLNFSKIVGAIYDAGYRRFIECGGGDIVTRIVTQNLVGKPDVTAQSTADVLIGAGEAATQSGDRADRRTATSAEETGGSRRTVPPAPSAPAVPASEEGLPHALSAPSRDTQARSGMSDLAKRRTAPDASVVAKDTAVRPAAEHRPIKAAHIEGTSEMPVAIVSMGCVLPGADNPEAYWRNVLEGNSGIVDLADGEPAAARDFLVGDGTGRVTVVPDKTYTLLHGSIVDVPHDARLLAAAYDEREFQALSKAQRLLAAAAAQSLARLKHPMPSASGGKIQCIVGSTADGCKEYDEALFNESLQQLLATLDEPESFRRPFSAALEQITGHKTGTATEFTQYKMYKTVFERILRHPIKTYVVDAACSSSLYSICLGMKALQDAEADIVLAGGVFAPGPANNTLFAQFRGLTPRESRPFDAAADGVVFGDGAGIVILKRLPDALADDDDILGVIRGVGLSSDGKSPSINVPTSGGQAIAIRRAYQGTGLHVDTLQYVEAHATATPVGDAVEFNALREALSGRDPALPAIQLGSVKALIGHTGWTAGVASVIKVCKAFEAQVVPPQYNYQAANREIDLAQSPFVISPTSCPWPDNIDGYPRRAGINGFGFGGANAHLILEAFEPVYHRELRTRPLHDEGRQDVLAVVGVGTLFPQEGIAGQHAYSSKFARESLRLPAGKRLLPDVTEHMDASQYLAGLAAEAVFATMPDLAAPLKRATGIVLGLESKTERGAASIGRIFVDRLRRKFGEYAPRLTMPQADAERILNALIEIIERRNLPSGPYTLPGLMPNVAAGRIASLFDLNGPNIVVDSASHSLVQAIRIARQFLAHGDCELALAGAINADGGTDDRCAEAALLLALTSVETARREAWPVLGTLTLCDAGEPASSAHPVTPIYPNLDYAGACGSPEIAWAVKQLSAGGPGYRVTVPMQDGQPSTSLLFAPAGAAAEASRRGSSPRASAPITYNYVQGTPISCYAPQLVAAASVTPVTPRRDRHFVFLTDQPDVWTAIEDSGALAGLEYKVICPKGAPLRNAVPVDLSGEDAVRNSLMSLAGAACDRLIAVRSLKGRAADTLLVNPIDSERAWLDLFFAACRHYYERIEKRSVAAATLCLDAQQHPELDPYTGLAAGFMKSVARELPGGICRIVNTDAVDFGEALRLVEIEFGQSGGPDEVHYLRGQRHVMELVPVPKLTRDERPYLDSSSVVIAAGGGRGVTAALVERLLEDFGCRVIAVGRTDPSSVPDEIRGMDEQALQNYETEFYRHQLKHDKRARIADLKRQYLSYRAALEVREVTQRLQAVGRYDYRCVDLTDEAATEACVEAVYGDQNRVDLVLYGAGIQVSKTLAKKSLSEFRQVVAAKLAGLSHLYRACERRRREQSVHYHLLTSAFSYLGNDGQCDYGAANEAMNRLAVAMNAASGTGHWSSLAWLGWAGIGMTRDSEYAALAASRRLRGVTRAEGQELFSDLMKGTPMAPANVLLASGEIDYYAPRIKTPASATVAPVDSRTKPAPRVLTIDRAVSLRSDPYLVHHLVDGIPTLPGALIILIVAEAARQLRPSLKVVSFEQARFHRFIRVYEDRETTFRVHTEVVSEAAGQTCVGVRLSSDFVHRSGMVLQKDILQHEITVRMAAAPGHPPPRHDIGGTGGRRLADPYVMKGSPVGLSGPFKTISNITAGRAFRRADYKLANWSGAELAKGSGMATVMLMDALWRFGAIEAAPDGSMPIHVPEKCERMNVYFDFARVDLPEMLGTLILSGANPCEEGDALRIGPVFACDIGGNVLLSVEGGICRQLGNVRNADALQAPVA